MAEVDFAAKIREEERTQIDVASNLREQASTPDRAQNVANVLGVSMDSISMESLGIPTRAVFSLASNFTDLEVKFNNRFPDGAITQITITEDRERPVMDSSLLPQGGGVTAQHTRIEQVEIPVILFRKDVNDPNSPIRFVDPPGYDQGDWGDIVGPAIEFVPPIMASFASPPTRVYQTLAAITGSFVGSSSKRIANQLTGAESSFTDELGGVAGDVAVNGLFAFGTMTLFQGIIPSTAKERASVTNINKMRARVKADEGIDIPQLMTFQRTPEAPVQRRMGQQAIASSRFGQEYLKEQREKALAAVLGARRTPLREAAVTGQNRLPGRIRVARQLRTVANQAFNRSRSAVRNGFARVTLRAGDKSFRESFNDIVSSTRSIVTKAYGVADEAAALERPVFSFNMLTDEASGKTVLAELKEVQKGIQGLAEGGAIGPQATFTMGEQISVTPLGQLSKIIDEIKNLSPNQIDYEIVKQLRTRIFELREFLPFDRNFASVQADKAYALLSKVLNNPTTVAPKYVTAITQANAAAIGRFRALENAQLEQIIKTTTNTGELVQRFGDPNTLDDSVMGLLSRHAKPEHLNEFKLATLSRALDESSATTAVGKLRAFESQDSAQFQFLTRVGGSNIRNSLFRTANRLDDIDASVMGQMIERGDAVALSLEPLMKRSTPEAASSLLAGLGGTGSRGHALLRSAVWDDLFQGVIKADQNGVMGINTADLTNAIFKLEKTGVWESILTKTDRLKMTGIRDMLSLRAQSGGDTGTILEVASIISQLKDPSTFLSGVKALTANKILAYFFASRISDKLLVSGLNRDLAKPAVLMLGMGRAIEEAVNGTNELAE